MVTIRLRYMAQLPYGECAAVANTHVCCRSREFAVMRPLAEFGV